MSLAGGRERSTENLVQIRIKIAAPFTELLGARFSQNKTAGAEVLQAGGVRSSTAHYV
jgi:hypothetical protein